MRPGQPQVRLSSSRPRSTASWSSRSRSRAGDVVVFTEALTHGTLPWQGAEQRRTLLFKYSPGNSAYSHVQWPDVLLAACTARQRLLLQPPSVGGHQPVVP